MGVKMQSRLLFLAALMIAVCAAQSSSSSRIKMQPMANPFKPAASALGVPIVDPPKRVAGYFQLARTYSAEMFFFYFQARTNPGRAPLVLWMTGGPGCSSELAVLYENGPYTLAPGGQSLVETQYGWDVSHNMIFVDQPIGTGFSYTEDDRDDVTNEVGVADDMLDFLWEFFKVFPDLADRPLFITGESYAGHYVPAVSHRIWLANKNKEGPHVNLQGLAVGNGLTSPSIQFNAYGDFAVQNNLIGARTRAVMGFFYPLCALANSWCEATNWDFVCAIGMQFCMATQFQPILAANPSINVYDITKKCEGRLCYDFTDADKFLNSKATRDALGVGDREWVSCNPEVYAAMMGDWLHRFDTVLPDMMADGIRVMIYAGDLDLICNWVGNRRWVDSLEWSGAEAWGATDDRDWVVAGKVAGRVKSVGPLSFVQVFQAGHMVPMDQPQNALAMISQWTRNLSLAEAAPMSDMKAATTDVSDNLALMHAHMEWIDTQAMKQPVVADNKAVQEVVQEAAVQMRLDSGGARSYSRTAAHMISHLHAAAAKAAGMANGLMSAAARRLLRTAAA